MNHHLGWVPLVSALVVLSAAGAVAAAGCQGKAPDVVLDCFSEAYSERSAEKLDSVLAADYIWVAVSPPEVDVFARSESVAASLKMFEDESVEDVRLEFEDGYRVVNGSEPNTWRIEDLRALLKVKTVGLEDVVASPLCATLYVRRTSADPESYQVYREVFFEQEGCVGK